VVKCKKFIGKREATPTQPNKYSTVASNTNNIFVGKDLSEDVKMFVRASVAENTWKKHNSAWQCVKCYSTVDAESIDWSLCVDNFFPV
jgi:hypothetical protein